MRLAFSCILSFIYSWPQPFLTLPQDNLADLQLQQTTDCRFRVCLWTTWLTFSYNRQQTAVLNTATGQSDRCLVFLPTADCYCDHSHWTVWVAFYFNRQQTAVLNTAILFHLTTDHAVLNTATGQSDWLSILTDSRPCCSEHSHWTIWLTFYFNRQQTMLLWTQPLDNLINFLF